MPRYDDDWYSDAERYWNEMPWGGSEYLTQEEIAEDYPDFLDMLRAVDMGFRPTQTLGWYSLKEKYGLDDRDFDWDDFREWYEETH